MPPIAAHPGLMATRAIRSHRGTEIRDFIVAHPDRADAIANHLFLTACSFGVSDVPDDLRFVYRFDDAFSLAHEGTYGEPETVYREFIHELEKFTPVA